MEKGVCQGREFIHKIMHKKLNQLMESSTGKAQVQFPAPHFEGPAFHGDFKQVKLEDYLGKYLVLFFYPLDFTFVCPTEIIEFSNKYEEFKKNNCEVLGCSIDSIFSHMEYSLKPREEGGIGTLNFPLLSDITKQISKDYGVYIEEGNDKGLAMRGTFIIDKKGIIKHISKNDLGVGRNVDEVLRLVKAFQFVDEHGMVCPSKWKGKDDPAMKPDHKSDYLKKYWKEENK